MGKFEIDMKDVSLYKENTTLYDWFEYTRKKRLIEELQYETFEHEEITIQGGRGELVFAKSKNDNSKVVIKKVTTDGDYSSRKKHFIYEVSASLAIQNRNDIYSYECINVLTVKIALQVQQVEQCHTNH